MENSQRTRLPDGGTEVQKRWDREERLLGKHTKTLFKSLENKSVKFQEVPNTDRFRRQQGDTEFTERLQGHLGEHCPTADHIYCKLLNKTKTLYSITFILPQIHQTICEINAKEKIECISKLLKILHDQI